MNRGLLSAVMGGALLVGGVASLPASPVVAQDATPAAECPTTTPEENKELVRRWFEALSAGRGEELAALAAPDVVYHDPSPQKQAQTGGVQDWASARAQDYPDLDVTVEQIIAEGDMVASYQRYTGTQQGDIEDQRGIPATGLSTEWVGMATFRVECGKIAELWSLADDLGRLQRLGVITDDELQSVEPVATPSS